MRPAAQQCTVVNHPRVLEKAPALRAGAGAESGQYPPNIMGPNVIDKTMTSLCPLRRDVSRFLQCLFPKPALPIGRIRTGTHIFHIVLHDLPKPLYNLSPCPSLHRTSATKPREYSRTDLVVLPPQRQEREYVVIILRCATQHLQSSEDFCTRCRVCGSYLGVLHDAAFRPSTAAVEEAAHDVVVHEV